MKTKTKYVVFILLFLILLCQTILCNNTKTDVFADNSSEIIMEVNSGRILYSKSENEKRYMASTTKILTAITIIENCNLNDIVTVSNKSVGVEGSSIYLEEGEKLSVSDLLYGLMLRSGNDCAETLALYCSGSIQKFAELMNLTAKKIGAKNSNFVNPHGLHNDNHYTTAYDLALISCYAMKNSDFRKIVSTKRKVIPQTTRDYDRILINKNKMLSEFEGSTGIKTGYTKKAGRCLVSSCIRNGMELVCVVLNCPPMFERSKELLLNAFNDYKTYKILESDYIIDFVKTKTGKEIAIHIDNDINLPLTENEFKNIEITYEYPTIIENSIKNTEKFGRVKIYSQNNLIFEEKIYTIIDVDI